MDDYRLDLDILRNEIDSLEGELRDMQARLDAQQAMLAGVEQPRRADPEIEIPEPARHEFFDELVNDIIETAARETAEIEGTVHSAKVQEYEDLKNDLLPKIELENLYRLYGITAFPVNDPDKRAAEEMSEETTPQEDDKYLGIRFDVYNQRDKRYAAPHYIILRRSEKNDGWELFKTTVPRYIPLRQLALQYLNSNTQRFVVEVRAHLVRQQLKAEVFGAIRDMLDEDSRMEFDLNYTKVKLYLKKKVSVVLICSLTEVVNVLPEGPKDLGIKLEVMLRGKISGLDTKVSAALAEI